MIETVTLLAFVPAAMLLNLTPGADMMFCFGQGLKSGPRPALVASAACREAVDRMPLACRPASRRLSSG